MMRTHCPLSTSHTRRVPSSLLLSRLLLSGVKAIAYTAAVCPCSAVRELPCSTPQSQIISSKPQLATVRPSGLQATARTRSVCPVSVWRTRPLATSHSLTVWSKLPLASCVPSGAKASPNTQLVCPASVCTHMAGCVPCICHNRIRPSKPPLASRLPSGLQATVYTGLGGPSSICRFVPDVASQSRTIVSSPPLASMRPSGAKARLWMLSVCQLVQSRVTCPPGRVPRSRSHTLIVPSQLPLASSRSSRLKARVDTVSVCACQTRYKLWPPCCHTRISPRQLPAAQCSPLLLMATDRAALKASVKTVSRSVAPAREASCISTPCSCTPRKTRRDRSRPLRFPRSTRSDVTRLAGPYPCLSWAQLRTSSSRERKRSSTATCRGSALCRRTSRGATSSRSWVCRTY